MSAPQNRYAGIMEDEKRVEAALKAVDGIPTQALKEGVIQNLLTACRRMVAALQDVGMTGDAGIDGAGELAFKALRKMEED